MTRSNSNWSKFVHDQLSTWKLASDNYKWLKDAAVRAFDIRGLKVQVQFNPARAISSKAETDAKTLSERPCFLCAENRPKEQQFMPFEGAKGKKYNIQVNPYPILPCHFVVAAIQHTPQSIWHRYVDMLRLSKRHQDYTFVYNGPKSGASAPDHFHFQAFPTRLLPLENDIRDGRNLTYVTRMNDVSVYRYDCFANGIFVIFGQTSKSMSKMFYKVLDCAEIPAGDTEPRFNLYTFRHDGQYCTIVVFRSGHRSCHYNHPDPAKRLAMSPGCVDMGGVFVTVEKSDFERLDENLLAELIDGVTITKDASDAICNRLSRGQKMLQVKLAEAAEFEFEMLSGGACMRKAYAAGDKVEYGGSLYDELYFDAKTPSTVFAEPSFILGGNSYAGALKIVSRAGVLSAVNVIGAADYVLGCLSFDSFDGMTSDMVLDDVKNLASTLPDGDDSIITNPLYRGCCPNASSVLKDAIDLFWGNI